MDLILFFSPTEGPGSSFERSLNPGSDPASIKIPFLSNDLLAVNKTSFHLGGIDRNISLEFKKIFGWRWVIPGCTSSNFSVGGLDVEIPGLSFPFTEGWTGNGCKSIFMEIFGLKVIGGWMRGVQNTVGGKVSTRIPPNSTTIRFLVFSILGGLS